MSTQAKLEAAIRAGADTKDKAEDLVAAAKLFLLDQSLDSEMLSDGVSVAIPVSVADPLLSLGAIATVQERHAAAITALKARQRAILVGVASAIVSAGTVALAGGGAAALIPAAKSLLDAIREAAV